MLQAYNLRQRAIHANILQKNRNSNLAKITISILVDFDKISRFLISILRSSQH